MVVDVVVIVLACEPVQVLQPSILWLYFVLEMHPVHVPPLVVLGVLQPWLYFLDPAHRSSSFSFSSAAFRRGMVGYCVGWLLWVVGLVLWGLVVGLVEWLLGVVVVMWLYWF